MHTFEESSTLVGVSELRTRLAEILTLARKSKILLGRRHKPVAVILPIEKYEKMEALLDRVEDAVLGYLASARDKKTKEEDYDSLEEAERKVGLRK